MNTGMSCPFCNSVFPINTDTVRIRYPSFSSSDSEEHANHFGKGVRNWKAVRDAIAVKFALCPSCNKHSISIEGLGLDVAELLLDVVPSSSAKQFPEYIPLPIRNDYEEACKIVNLSPKASATLSRRCLQGILRDFWKLPKKRNLFEEIESVKDKVDPQVKKVLDSVRQIGNIGAHMEYDINLIVDIDPDEAKQLIKLIEYLIEQWYIKRHETDELLNSIVKINGDKQEKRNT